MRMTSLQPELLFLAGVVVLGIAAQWLAWRMNLPAILVLLIVGLAAGQFVDPEEYLGSEILFPVVSLSVAVVLFEGGLSLRLREIEETAPVVIRLVIIGVLATWVLGAACIWLLFDVSRGIAALGGALLVVSGPTVIMPILRQIRPAPRIGSVVKWEGIVIDPVGATLALLVFEAVVGTGEQGTVLAAARGLALTVLIGGVGGVLVTAILVLLLKKRWVPEYLESPVLLAVVFAAFTASNFMQSESGLLTVTVLGVALANQRFVGVHHLVAFKENLRVLLISILFILLTSRLRLEDLLAVGADGLLLVLALVLVVRPAAVLLSSVGSSLSRGERAFLAFLAPRGIVAAAVSSVFALEMSQLAELRIVEPTLAAQAQQLVLITFLVIVGTVTLYGLAAGPLAGWLKIADPDPQGILFAGADPFIREIAKAVQDAGFSVLLVDRNRDKIALARMAGLPTVCADIVSEYAREEIEFGGIGRFLAMTPNDEVNALAALQFAEVFGRSDVYQLATAGEAASDRKPMPARLRGRPLFGPKMTYGELARRFAKGAKAKSTPLTEEFGETDFRRQYGESAIVLFVITESKELLVNTADSQAALRAGRTVISLVDSTENVPDGLQ